MSVIRHRKLLISITLIIFMSLWVCAFAEDSLDDNFEVPLEEIRTVNTRGRVVRNLDLRQNMIEYSGGSIEDSVQRLEVKIIEGQFKGEIVEAEYPLSLDFIGGQNNSLLRAGDEVLMTLELDDNDNITSAVIYNPVREKSIIFLIILFAVIILSVGRLKGFKALVSLIFTVLAIVVILLPLLIKGRNPMLVTIGTSVVITGVTILLVGGFNKKSLAAILGTTGGVVAAGLIAQIIGYTAKLTGLGTEESQLLLYIPQNVSFNYRGLLFSGIILGALGACMDVGMSLASAMFEIKEQNPELNRLQLISSGMNIGRDMMGTMANTLILAYVGGCLPLMMVLMAHNMPLSDIINQDGFASEVMRSLAGSIGLILTIPLTALVASFLCEGKGKEKSYQEYNDIDWMD
ncbi:MAG: YibE/F family protein [Clostridiaceae bacterium]|nr:YibE/F family protein [Clostridiaceae bacterium]